MIEGVVLRHELAARPRQAQDPHGPRRRRHGRDQGDLVQPALARGAADARDARAAAREAEPLRLPGGELRPRRGDRDGRLRTRLPGQRGARPEAAARARRRGARARAGRGRCAARRRSRPPSGCRCAPTRSSRCTGPARPRRRRWAGAGSPSTSSSSSSSRSPAVRPSGSCSSRRRCRRPGELLAALSRRAPVHAHRRAGARDRRDRPRSRPHDADAAAAPGRRRLGQDGRRARDAPARRRGGPAGSADGADRGARRAALPHDRGHLHRARRARRAADERARRRRSTRTSAS